MITFDINKFEEAIAAPKFELGKEYAITFDPDYVLESYIEYDRVFSLDNAGSALFVSNADIFSNPIDAPDVAVCKQTLDQVYTKNCSIVYFKFVPLGMFLRREYADRIYENGDINGDILIKNRIFVDTVALHVHGTCDKYIITDDANNIMNINLL